MTEVSIILRRPPYGSVDAAEAVRHALGGATQDVSVHLILLAGGVNAARKGQNTSGTGYTSIEEGIRDCIDMGVNVYCDGVSLAAECIDTRDIIEGVVIADTKEIGTALARSSATMIF